MAVSVIGVSKVGGRVSQIYRTLLTSQRSSHPSGLNLKRSICGKTQRDPNVKRLPPFPYKEKNYTLFRALFDVTTKRLNENSKVIVVDGAIAAGKSAFAKALAEDLDMLYVPMADMDMIYINPYGYDLRQLDPEMPDSLKSYDTKNFCENPHHVNAAALQLHLYKIKFSQYIDALAHLLNTGQGIVMDKSIYSDYVYTEAMVKEGFMSKIARSVYYDVKQHTIDELMRPHLAIYLDMPVSTVQEKIKQRGYPHEQNSKALSTSFLTALDESYKRQYLKEVSAHSELLIYDWSDGGDVEVVVEDIERIDFDRFTVHDEKMKDWRLPHEEAWLDQRRMFTNSKANLMMLFNIPRFDCPELVADGSDMEKFSELWFSAPGMKYGEGYNSDLGDKNILWKMFPKDKFTFNS